jgi:hypothetical protein
VLLIIKFFSTTLMLAALAGFGVFLRAIHSSYGVEGIGLILAVALSVAIIHRVWRRWARDPGFHVALRAKSRPRRETARTLNASRGSDPRATERWENEGGRRSHDKPLAKIRRHPSLDRDNAQAH